MAEGFKIQPEKDYGKTYLYRAGNEYSALTGGWSTSGYSFYTGYTITAPTKELTDIKLSAPSSSLQASMSGTENLINLTNYSKLRAKIYMATAPKVATNLVISTTKTNVLNNAVTSNQLDNPVTGTTIIHEQDITNLNGSYYISVIANNNFSGGTGSCDAKVLEVWLE